MSTKKTTKLTEEEVEKQAIGIIKDQNFTFLIYPESAPEDWIEKLEQLGQPIAISPLHDMDKSNVEGQEYKKPHYHVMYRANNNVTADSVRKKIQRKIGIKSVAKVQITDNVENLWLYLTHESKDAIEKNKHIYDRNDIQLLNNFDIERYVSYDTEALSEMFDMLCDLIIKHKLSNMVQLENYLADNSFNQHGITSRRVLRKVIQNRTSMLRLYFDGVYQEERKEIERKERLVEANKK
uniref:replication protein n=1 Tax=Streptococcus pluranimalium TaxID=82348 RepID=UPI003F68ECB9